MLASVPGPVVVDRAEVGDGLVSALVLRCAGEIDSFNAHELAAAVGDGLTGSFPETRAPRRPPSRSWWWTCAR